MNIQAFQKISEELRLVLAISAVLLATVGSVNSQPPRFDREDVKTVSAPLPAFPNEAKDRIYGETVRVLVDVDEEGKVKGALGRGPLAPCSNLNDPVAETVRKAAVAAAMATRFEPFLENGKPTLTRLSIEYRLRPRVTPLPEEDRRIIIGGIINSKAQSLTPPEYPEAARASRLRGGISVQIPVGENGDVLSAAAISGHPQFSESGVRAACTAKFLPTTLEGKPAKILGVLSFNFVP